jgi:hypothetical protein
MSESDGRKHVATAIGALGVLVVGCGSSAPTATPDALPTGNQSDASGTFAGSERSDAGTSGLSVAITPAAPSVCPGECVTLAATASGGRAPYAFAWSPEAASDGGDITVCPGQTTTYGVNATDSSGSGGELQQAPRLDEGGRRRVHEARTRAVEALAREVAREPDASSMVRLGVPSASQARAVVDELRGSLWSTRLA